MTGRLAQAVLLVFSMAWVACKPAAETGAEGEKHGAAARSSAAVAAAPSGSFGRALDPATPFVELSTLRASPKDWDGKRVRTSGKVVAVCQSAGCWADLQPVEGAVGAPMHVAMHGHAFFLPRTSRDRIADVEGTVEVRTLSAEQADHFNSEGASLVAGTPLLAMDAVGVVLR